MKSSLIYFAAAICLFLGPSLLHGQKIVIKAGINYTDLDERTDMFYTDYPAEETIKTKLGYNVGFSFDLLPANGESWNLSLAPIFTHLEMTRETRIHSSDEPREKVSSYAISEDYIHVPLNVKFLLDFSEWQAGAFAGFGPGFCASDPTWSPLTFHVNIGLMGVYKKFIAEISYIKVASTEQYDMLHDFHSFVFNVGYAIK